MRNNSLVFSEGLSSLAECGRTSFKNLSTNPDPFLVSPQQYWDTAQNEARCRVCSVLKCSDSGEIIINNRSFEDVKWCEVINISRWPLRENYGKWKYQSTWATITQYHGVGHLNNTHLFPIVLEAGSMRSRQNWGRFPLMPLSWVCRPRVLIVSLHGHPSVHVLSSPFLFLLFFKKILRFYLFIFFIWERDSTRRGRGNGRVLWDLGVPFWPHYTLIPSLKTPYPNMVPFWGPGVRASTCEFGERGYNSAITPT